MPTYLDCWMAFHCLLYPNLIECKRHDAIVMMEKMGNIVENVVGSKKYFSLQLYGNLMFVDILQPSPCFFSFIKCFIYFTDKKQAFRSDQLFNRVEKLEHNFNLTWIFICSNTLYNSSYIFRIYKIKIYSDAIQRWSAKVDFSENDHIFLSLP